jgi:hypothetical protein
VLDRSNVPRERACGLAAPRLIRRVMGMLVMVMALSRLVSAEQPPDYVVIVHVQNEAPVAPWLLHSAEEETARAFRRIGVELRWRESGTQSGENTGAPEVSIVLMSAAMGAKKARIEHIPDSTLATASRLTGRAYVFCDRVRDVSNRYALDERLLLARTFTHELGHTLASIGHDTIGAMKGSLELTQAGFFGFTDAQGRAIRHALAAAMAADVPKLALRVAP